MTKFTKLKNYSVAEREKARRKLNSEKYSDKDNWILFGMIEAFSLIGRKADLLLKYRKEKER